MRAERRIVFWLGLLLAIVAGGNVRSAIDFNFVDWDDDINITYNPNLGPPSAATMKWMATDASYMRRYIPLGWLGFATVYEFSGLSPTGYHAANIGWHVVNTVLLFGVLLQMLRRWMRGTSGNWTATAAAIGAGLWALHPYRAETVGWASGLLYGPAGALALVAVWAYLRMLGSGGPHRRGLWLGLVVAAYLGSLLAYPIGLGLLGLFFVMDEAERIHGPAGRITVTRTRWWLEKLALTGPWAAMVTVTVAAGVSVRPFWAKPVSLAEFGWIPRAAQAAYAWAGYLMRRWWPVDLTPAPTRLVDFHARDPIFWLSGLLVVATTVALVARSRWRRGPWLWWAAFALVLAPMLGFMEHPYFACDRYDYLPGMVVSAAVAAAVVGMERWRSVVVAASLAGLAGLAWLQHEQLMVWRDSDALEQRMISESDNQAFRITRYGSWARSHAERGEYAQAEAILRECEATSGGGPWNAELRAGVAQAVSAAAVHTRLANDFVRAGRPREAAEHLKVALSLDSSLAAAAINYASLRAISGDPTGALHWYWVATARSPNDVPAAVRCRVLSLIAEGFFATHRPRLAERAVERALLESRAGIDSQPLQHQLELYRQAAEATRS